MTVDEKGREVTNFQKSDDIMIEWPLKLLVQPSKKLLPAVNGQNSNIHITI